MSTKNKCQHQQKNTNPFATFIECVGVAVVAIAAVPSLIIDAVISSATS